MRTLDFDAALLPAAHRLAAFRTGASDFQVDAIGDPLDFSVQWRLLKLGDLNAIRSHITPVHYRRDQAMIEADGEDRIAIHYYLSGSASGVLAGHPAAVGPGAAMVWDLTRTIDVRAGGPVEMLIVTLPRYMLQEVLPFAAFSTVLEPTAELALAAAQLGAMIDDADDLDDAAAPFLSRALRDLFAVAILPALAPADAATSPAPLLRRVCELVDSAPDREVDVATMAATLGASVADIRVTTDNFGGLPVLVERRRLLAAYRLLCDPAEIAPVSTIAQRCGFIDMPRFSRRFRELFQVSPSDLRQFRRGSLPQWAGAYHVEDDYGAFIAR